MALPPKQPSPAPPAAPRLALLLNGEPHEVAADATVLDLVTGLGRDPRTVAVERNGELVPRAAFPATRLAAGDRLEVVHFVQGGCR
jgi:sulfur carrier protein